MRTIKFKGTVNYFMISESGRYMGVRYEDSELMLFDLHTMEKQQLFSSRWMAFSGDCFYYTDSYGIVHACIKEELFFRLERRIRKLFSYNEGCIALSDEGNIYYLTLDTASESRIIIRGNVIGIVGSSFVLLYEGFRLKFVDIETTQEVETPDLGNIFRIAPGIVGSKDGNGYILNMKIQDYVVTPDETYIVSAEGVICLLKRKIRIGEKVDMIGVTNSLLVYSGDREIVIMDLDSIL